jgi:hypothetical protein
MYDYFYYVNMEFENRILRRIFRIFEPKNNENEGWKRLHNEELHGLYRCPNIVWHVARMRKIGVLSKL